ncbi:hypothetical protein NDU88_000771 [Pleurodeles waltl]|uniref:Uncharacterized protein n=1 Tax=Pleurodeles waltl TaxID=8319 RepID=A0AAV7KMW6_PLEWA|nr:hypothetical protein NDU88_000771 [Pleurodeles waltl]
MSAVSRCRAGTTFFICRQGNRAVCRETVKPEHTVVSSLCSKTALSGHKMVRSILTKNSTCRSFRQQAKVAQEEVGCVLSAEARQNGEEDRGHRVEVLPELMLYSQAY